MVLTAQVKGEGDGVGVRPSRWTVWMANGGDKLRKGKVAEFASIRLQTFSGPV